MRRKRLLGLPPVVVAALLAVGQTPAPAFADPDVEAVVMRLFDAMRTGDGDVAATLFHPEARLFSVGEQNGVPVMSASAAADFVGAIGAPRTEVWDERIANLEIRVDGNLATAWMDYAFYLDDAFSHCGVNAFQLFRSDQGWQVIHITDTRRREECRA